MIPNWKKVSVGGTGMKSHPGFAVTAFTTLHEHGIERVVVTTFPIRVAARVRHEEVKPVVQALHSACGRLGAEEHSDA